MTSTLSEACTGRLIATNRPASSLLVNSTRLISYVHDHLRCFKHWDPLYLRPGEIKPAQIDFMEILIVISLKINDRCKYG